MSELILICTCRYF